MNLKSYEQNINNNVLRQWLNKLLFDLTSPLGRNANLFSMLVILCSVLISMIGTIDSVSEQVKVYIRTMEIAVTLLFSLEYVFRIYAGR